MNALLLIKPGSVRDGLDALLSTIPVVQLIAHPGNVETALDFCKLNKTELVVIEVKPNEQNLLNKVPEMKSLCPEGHVVTLIHDENDRDPAEQAQADLILNMGTRASKLKAEIQSLVNTTEPTSK